MVKRIPDGNEIKVQKEAGHLFYHPCEFFRLEVYLLIKSLCRY